MSDRIASGYENGYAKGYAEGYTNICTKKYASRPTLKVKLLSEHAILPTRASADAAGYDLYAAEDVVVINTAVVATDLAIAVPSGTYGRIAPRSSMAVKNVHVGGGVIDADYRGNVRVILCNYSDKPFTITKGDRIAQLILEEISIVDVERVDMLEESERNDGGFGSTGK